MDIAGAQIPLKAHVQPSARRQDARRKVEWNAAIKSKRKEARDEYITSTVLYPEQKSRKLLFVVGMDG